MLLPSGIWSLVSLLFLASDEENMTERMKELLEVPACAPELAADTLQVCTFPRCSIIACLLSAPSFMVSFFSW